MSGIEMEVNIHLLLRMENLWMGESVVLLRKLKKANTTKKPTTTGTKNLNNKYRNANDWF